MHSYTFSHHSINTVRHSNMFHPLRGHLRAVHLIHLNSKVNKMSHQSSTSASNSGDLAVQMCQVYSLRVTVWGLKHGGVTCSVNGMVTE